ncbi:MAG TPA: hypothetical protein VLA29_08025, partial [Acidimicrobiia bacterium]|nr:hypothetical protein [Acidimicrobiia bacterium]
FFAAGLLAAGFFAAGFFAAGLLAATGAGVGFSVDFLVATGPRGSSESFSVPDAVSASLSVGVE